MSAPLGCESRIELLMVIIGLRGKFSSSLSFFRSSSTEALQPTVGEGAWKDRQEAEKDIKRWLSEHPSTFITVTGPPGSGKVSLVTRVLNDQKK